MAIDRRRFLGNGLRRDRGVAACPHEFYAKWIADPEGTREMVESFNRSTIGTEECPIESIPNKKIVHR